MEFSLGHPFTALNTRSRPDRSRTTRSAAEGRLHSEDDHGSSASAGGTPIPQEWTDFVIAELGPKVVFTQAGPNVLPMQHQILNIRTDQQPDLFVAR